MCGTPATVFVSVTGQRDVEVSYTHVWTVFVISGSLVLYFVSRNINYCLIETYYSTMVVGTATTMVEVVVPVTYETVPEWVYVEVTGQTVVVVTVTTVVYFMGSAG